VTGSMPIGGTHEFVVPDVERARSLADALSRHGFALVTAEPRGSGAWRVTAYDEGPYRQDGIGHRTIDTVARQAATLAREHSGYPAGGTRCTPDTLAKHRHKAPIVLTNPGARPPVPTIVMTPAPSDVALALTPDTVRPGTADLTGMRDIAWARLRHANGSAEKVPDAVEALAVDTPAWDERLDELLGDDVLHQGSCYSATAPTLAFLIRLAASGTLPARRRFKLCEWLIFAAHQRASVFLSNPDYDAYLHRTPKVPVHVQEVHDTIGEHLPALLGRWGSEPPAVRYLLAALAGLFPEPGRQVTTDIVAMAAEYPNTQRAAYLNLAAALLQADDDQASRICQDIFNWNDEIPVDWLEAPGVSPAIRAGRILADGMLFTTTSTQ
jgi:hypothetical protein